MNRPIIIGRNDGCNECDHLGYICDECVNEWLGDELGDENKTEVKVKNHVKNNVKLSGK